jgi:hypothetical protein
MALRRDHSQAEIETLAEKFRESWSKGQIVKSWLRAHGAELRRLVREEDWAWANIGRALSLAGIVYRTGNAWSPETLRKAVTLACKPGKRALREARRQTVSPAASEIPQPQHDGTGEFRVVRRRPVETSPSKGDP